MLVGAPKAGTTSLYRYAAQHPGIVSHDQREMTYFFSNEEYRRGYDACMGKYMPAVKQTDSVILAKHVFTMYSPDAVARLRDHNPHALIFALLRDPVRRAYSSYWYSRRRGWDTAKSFDEAIKWEMDRPGQEADWLADRDRMHLRVGIYHPYIRRLMETFGEDRVRVFLTDDLAQDAAGLCRTIYRTLVVDADFTPDLTRTHNPAATARSQTVARTVAGVLKSKGLLKRTVRRFIPHGLARRTRHALLRVNEKPFIPPPMPDDTRRNLADYFAPHNEELGKLIGRDLSAWSSL
jgi:Sulfotransferase domain